MRLCPLGIRTLAGVALLGALGFAFPAGAASLPFQGTLSLAFGPPFGLSFEASGSGVATVNGSGGGGHLTAWTLPAGAFPTSSIVTLTDTALAPVGGLWLTANNEAGSFSGTGGIMPLSGHAKVCLFAPCSMAPMMAWFPLSPVGQGGSISLGGAVNLTVSGAPWTTGTATAGSLPPLAGFRHGPASGTSSTAAVSGVVQLVSPFMLSTNLSDPFRAIPGYATLTFHFVPEPGTFVLLFGSIAMLAAGGRTRRRKRADG